MPPHDPERPPRASWPETIGAWLHVWTAPRDVELRTLSRRTATIIAAGLVAVVAVAALVVFPAIGRQKDEDARRQAISDARTKAARRAQTARDQAARFGAAERLQARTPAERRVLLHRVEAAITADANARTDARSRSTTCRPLGAREGTVAPEDDPAQDRGAYDCMTLIRRITGQGKPGSLGYPYRAIVDFGARTWAFCKVTQFPGEQIVPDPRDVIALPEACRIPS